MSSRLLLIDGHSLAFRAFYALPVENFSTSTGQATNAVYGFVSMLLNAVRDLGPDHVAVAFDLPGGTFRTDEYPEYKGTRAETPQPFIGQVELIQEALDALGVTYLTRERYEADDIIATLARQGHEAGLEVLISSGDRDAFQLVRDGVTVLYPVRGVSEHARMDPTAVEAKYGVPPQRYRDLAALVGETSDNLPGVPGVGPKTAAKWIALYDGLDGVVAAAGQIKGKAGENLRAHLSDVLRNQRLNLLVDDLDLGVDVHDLVRRPLDVDAVDRLFDVLQIRGLRERVFSVLGEPRAEAADGPRPTRPEVDVAVLAGAEVAAWLAAAEGPVALAPQGSWGRGTGTLTGLGLARADGAVAYVALDVPDPVADDALGRWLGDPDAPVVLHDAKGPALAMAGRGWHLRGLVGDTALAAYLDRPDQRGYDLAALCRRVLDRDLEPVPEGQGELDLEGLLGADAGTGVPPAAQALGRAAQAVLDLDAALAARLDQAHALELYRTLELPLVGLLTDLERTGIAVDVPALERLDADFATRAASAAEAAYEQIGRPVNLASPKQLQVVLFDELDLPRTKKIKTGYTTDAEALGELFAKTGHPFLQHLLAHRDVTKLRQTVEGLRRAVGPDGRIHTTFQQTVAATGRLSSTDPNLQNIPVRTEAGRRIRAAFVVGDGYESLMTVDYSQVEMRLMAHLSGDAGLVEAFRSGEDLHHYVAGRVFGVEPQSVSPEMRARVKAMSYGLAYGLSAYGLSRQLGIAVDEAQKLMDDYFSRFGGVRDYLQRVVAEARSTGYTETILGRRRYLPDLTSDQRQRREMAERMALNAPVQGSAADLVKVAMLDVERELRGHGLRSRMLLQVHDELVLEVAHGERAQVEELVRRCMGRAARLDVPLEVNVGVGATWHDAAH